MTWDLILNQEQIAALQVEYLSNGLMRVRWPVSPVGEAGTEWYDVVVTELPILYDRAEVLRKKGLFDVRQ